MNKALFSLAIGSFGIGLTEFVMMGILPDVALALSISIPVAGHFISAYALGVVIGAPLLTAIGSRWPAHKVLMLLMVWFTVFNTLSALGNTYESLIMFRFLSGLPHGAFFGIGAVVASRLAKPGKEAKAIATMFTGMTISNVLGVPLGTFLGHNFSWNIAFYMAGFVGVLTIVGIYFWMPKLEKTSAKNIFDDLKVFKRVEFWIVFLLTTVGTGGFFAWYSYIAPLITDVAGHPESVVSYAMIIAGLGMVAGNFVGAKMAEKFSPINAVIAILVIMVVLLAANTQLAVDKTWVIIMTFFIGASAFALSAPIQMTMIQASKGAETLGSSMNQSAFNMGNASGAYFAGLPIAFGYGFTSADWVGAGMAGLGIFIAIAAKMLTK